MSPVKAVFSLALLSCAAVAVSLLVPGPVGAGVAVGCAAVTLAAAGLLTRALRAAQRRQIDAVRALLRATARDRPQGLAAPGPLSDGVEENRVGPALDPAPWFAELRAELERRQQSLLHAEAARDALGEQLAQAGCRAGAARDMAREGQLALHQAREDLEQLRAELPQRALARAMERAHARAAFDRVAQAVGEPLAALVAEGEATQRRAQQALAALGEARRLGDALQVMVINARLALESGRRDDQIAAAGALERMSEAASALLARVPDMSEPAEPSAAAVGKAVAAIEQAVAQAHPGTSATMDDDALLEQSLGTLGRQFGQVLLQLQATVREAAEAAEAAAASGGDGRDGEAVEQG